MPTLGDRGSQSAQPVRQRKMSWYSVTARPLYIELRALGLEVRVQDNPTSARWTTELSSMV